MEYNEILELIKVKAEMLPELDLPSDNVLLYSIMYTEEFLKNYCCVNEVPKGLKFTWADMALGKYLYDKRGLSGLVSDGDKKGETIKSITEGDISVTYATTAESGTDSNDAKLKNLVERWLFPEKFNLIRYRKVSW